MKFTHFEFIEKFKNIATNCGSKTAIIDKGGLRQTNYTDFFRIICQTMSYLVKQNIPKNSFIPILLSPSMEYLAAEIGIWMLGHASVPLSYDFPQERIQYIINHCEASIVIDENCWKEILQSEPVSTDFCTQASPNDNALILYTSGSTGNPKGILYTYKNLDPCINRYSACGLHSNDVFGNTTPFYFVVSLFIMNVLSKGATVNLVPDNVRKDAQELEKYIEKEGITSLFISPAVLKNFKNKSDSLRLVLTGSEQLLNIAPGSYRLINIFGMTEGGYMMNFAIDKPYENTPIGKPVEGLEAYIMDTDGNIVEDNIEGELYISGTLFNGYFKESKLTKQALKNGLFRTGDIVKRLPDGNIVYINRADWVVKVNGNRVDTGEIEVCVRSIPQIASAAVKGFPSQTGSHFLVLFYVEHEPISKDKIRQELSKKLMPYMLPSYFVKLDAIPVNINGKIDRKSLQPPIISDFRAKYEPPSNSTEEALVNAFQDVLEVERVSIDDDFFCLGGDSIRVISVMSKCADLPLTSELIYKLRTPRSLAQNCVQSETQVNLLDETYPLTTSQMGIYAESMQCCELYNNPLLFKIDKLIDINRLAESVEKVIAAHSCTQTRIFTDEDGNPRQYMHKGIYQQKIEKVEDKVFDKIKSELIQPFLLVDDTPLFRIRIFASENSQWLFIDFHHIIFDGVSYSVFIEDLNRAYNGEALKQEHSLFTTAIEEEQTFNSTEYEQDEAWYKKTFKNSNIFSPPLFNSHQNTKKVGQAKHTAKSFTTDDVRLFCTRHNITENVFFTAAFGCLLAKYTNSEESLFTTTFNGRNKLSSAQAIGMFARTYPIYCSPAEHSIFTEYISQVKEQILGCMTHTAYPFFDISTKLNINSSVHFIYQSSLIADGILGKTQLKREPLIYKSTNHSLYIQIFSEGSQYYISADWFTHNYTEKYIADMMICYETILRKLLNETEDVLEKNNSKSFFNYLNIVPPSVQSSLLKLGEGNTLQYDKSETIVDIFLKNADANLDKNAVIAKNGVLSYQKLNKDSDILATHLVSLGVTQDSFVAIMLPRVKEFMTATISVFKAGGAYLPLDVDYPSERITYQLKDSETKVLITTRKYYACHSSIIDTAVENIIFIDDFDFSSPNPSSVNFSCPTSPAYMLYTSGSTGLPKGVVVCHKSLLSFNYAMIGTDTQIWADDHTACYASFCFDISLQDLFGALFAGASLYIVPSSIRHSIMEMGEYFHQNKISGGAFPTTIGMEILNTLDDLPLRYMILIGEKLKPVKKSNTTVVNGYGPTEFTIISSSHTVNQEVVVEDIPIGQPLGNTWSYVLDGGLAMLPCGVPGELCLAGLQIAKGYWNRPELTSERFVQNPYTSCNDNQMLYRTGDIVCWNIDGELQYLGRQDTQIKLRGYRIELGEIETSISKYQGIKASVVEIKEIAGEKHLCAYYLSDEVVDIQELQLQLTNVLADYMVPFFFIRLEEFPMTSNGKIDCKQLPIPQLDVSKDEELVPPKTELQKMVFDIVSKLLGNSDFGINTNLFSMGLSSMTAVRLSAMMGTQLGINIPAPEILSAPKIEEFTQKKQTATSRHKAFAVRSHYPLTGNQEGIYIEWERCPQSVRYNIPSCFRFTNIDAKQLIDSIRKVIDAHLYVKARLHRGKTGDIFKSRNDDSEVDIYSKNVQGISAPSEFFQKRIRPFDLFGENLFRIEVYITPVEVFLFMDFHHIIFDGHSYQVLLSNIAKAYNGENISREVFTAYDFALENKNIKLTPVYVEAQNYFGKLLDKAETSVLNSFFEPKGLGASQIVSTEIDTLAISDYCQKYSVTENSFFLTMFMETLYRIIGEDSLSITSHADSRDDEMMENIVGMFVQTIPVIYNKNIRKQKSLADTIRMVQKQLFDTIKNSCYPFTEISAHYGLGAHINYIYQDTQINSLPLGDESQPVALSLDIPKFPIALEVILSEEGKHILQFEYDDSKYTKDDICLLQQTLLALTSHALREDINVGISSLPMISNVNQLKLLQLGYGGLLDYDKNLTFVDVFLNHVTHTPNKDAVVAENGNLSYQQLNKQSDILAEYLIALGACEDNFTAIMLPRMKEYVTAVIGVLKAGGAYVPIDAEYPNERIQFMLDNSKAKTLITTREYYTQKLQGQILAANNIMFIEEFSFAQESVNSINNSTPHSAAYMIYTSGSTGTPKGVVICHQSLSAFICAKQETAATVGINDRIACYANFSFDMSVGDLFGALSAGASLFIVPSQIRYDIIKLEEYLCSNQITGGAFPTQIGHELLKSADLHLRYIDIGGEKMKPIKENNVTVINGYGPTEFTDCALSHTVDPSTDVKEIPIGRPLCNVWAYILDKDLQLLPSGAVGELCLAGLQISKGYWQQPELTDNKFVKNPYTDCKENTRIYRTGDLARWNSKGKLEYIGRNDEQVKLRGYRIELGEIGSCLLQHSSIVAAVVGVRSIADEQHLYAWYTANNKVSNKELHQHLGKNLPEYMIPSAFEQLNELPLMPSGKINLEALPLPNINNIEDKQIVKANTELEKNVFESVVSLLGNSNFGINTNLFSIGLTSMTAVRLSALLAKQFNISIPAGKILAKPVIKEFTQDVAESFNKHKISEPRSSYPLTGSQKGIYVEWAQRKKSIQYNIPACFKFPTLDAQKLADAVEVVINSHPYIKACLSTEDNDIPMQYRNDYTPVEVLIENIENELDASFFQKRIRPFNLQGNQLYHVEIYNSPKHTYLFTDFHHIIFDGRSYELFFRDLANVYVGETITKESFSLFDLALEEKDILSSESCSIAEGYFEDLLGTANGSTVLPSSSQPSGMGREQVQIMEINIQKISEFCRIHSVTESSFFMSSLMDILHRLTRDEKIVVSTNLSGRKDEETDNIVGMLVKTLPVVYDASVRSKDFGMVAKDLQKQLFSTYEYDFYPYSSLARKYKLSPQINYVYQEESIDNNFCIGNCEGGNVPLSFDIAKFPLSVIITKGHKAYTITFEYDDSLYCQADIEMLKNSLSVITTEASDGASCPISSLSIINLEHTDKLMSLGYGGSKNYDKTLTFVDVFLGNAHRMPDKIAVTAENGVYTYSELNQVSDLLANHLIEIGINSDSFIGIMLPRIKEFVTASIAIFKAGCVYVPLDVEYPSKRIQFMLNDSNAKVLITTRECYNQKSSSTNLETEHIIFIDEFDFLQPNTKTINISTPNSLAYMIYTSGSTGVSKGVMISHRSLCAFNRDLAENATEKLITDNIACYANFSFDMSAEDIFGSLFAGASLFIVPSVVRHDLIQLGEYLCKNKIDGGSFPTQVGVELVNTVDLPLRYILVGGEKFRSVRSCKTKVLNGYGPTEFTNSAANHIYNSQQDIGEVPIGAPLKNVWAYVLDSQLELLPQKAVGELCLSGLQISNGYWNRPELTAEKFVANPYSTCSDNSMLYRTGDLVRWNEEGLLEYVSRIDNQIKLRGFRVELGEIESCLSKHPQIVACAADVKDIRNGQQLCAYYISDSEDDIESTELKDFLSPQLPEYMVPTYYIRIQKLPLNANGKLNRKELPIPHLSSEEKYTAPRSKTEQALAGVFANILAVDRIGIDDSFFTLGGDSIKAIRCISRLRQEGYMVQISALMQLKTIRHIATQTHLIEETISITPSNLGELEWEYGELESVMQHFGQDGITLSRIFPLTSMQQGMLYHRISSPNSSAYHIQSVYKVGHRLLHKQVLDAIEGTACNHPILHASVIYKEVSLPRQAILSGRLIEVSETELQYSGEKGLIQNINSLCKSDLLRGFDLQDDSLLRIQIIQSGECSYLLFSVHHIIVDGWSVPIYMNEFLRNLSLICEGHSLKEVLPETYTFEHAVREIASKDNSSGLQYWRELLADYETVAEIPISPSFKGEEVESTLLKINRTVNKELTEKLVLLSRKHDVTINTLLEAAWGIILQRYSNSSDVVFGKVVSGRNLETPNVENMVGLFINTIPVRVKSRVNETLTNLLLSIQQQAATSSKYDYIALNEIQKQSMLGSDLIKSLFIFENYYVQTATKADNVQLTQIYNREETNYNFFVTSYLTDELHFGFTANSYKYSKEDIENVYDSLLTLLQHIVKNGKKQNTIISELPVLTPEQTVELMELGHGGIEDYDTTITFVDSFLDNVQCTPEKEAVVASNGVYTYRELNRVSDILANHLIKLGVNTNNFVGIMLPRVKEFTAVSIALFKAGCAYVPLDVEYPDERILFMIRDSETKILITTREYYTQKTAIANFAIKHVIFIEDFDFSQPTPQPINKSTPSSMAYMIYTSGSTGTPKGVVVPHKALSAFLNWYISYNEVIKKDNLFCHSNFSFDGSIDGLYAPLYVGATSHIFSNTLRYDMYAMNKYIAENNITGGLFSTRFGIDYLNNHNTSLRYIILGGEKMTSVRKTSARVINGYGPTEFTELSVVHDYNPEQDTTEIPIGAPLKNIWTYVLDSELRLLPQKAVGELCLSGLQISNGYWNRPELTAEKFVPNPYSTCSDNSMLYRTGDLVRWNEEGLLEYVSRIDNQIKLRGFRVELGEIESCLSKFPKIVTCATDVKDISGSQQLCAYYISDFEDDIESTKLKDFLLPQLPEYMVPTYYIRIQKLPLNANGKLNRKELPLPHLGSEEEYTAPRNKTEQALASVFANILAVDRIGIDDSFFTLGGDSIKAIRCISRLRQEGYMVQIFALMQLKTIRLIARQTHAVKSSDDTIAISGSVPTTYIQQWFFDLKLPYPNHFNQSVMLECAQLVDESALRFALTALTMHHDMLRGYYKNNQQFIASSENALAELHVYDIENENMSENDLQNKIKELADKLQRSMELSKGGLFKCALFRCKDKQYLLITIHHLVVDGVSWRILVEDLNTAYHNIRSVGKALLPPKSLSFKAWSENVQQYRQSAKLQKEIGYWEEIQKCLNPTQPTTAKQWANEEISIDANITEKLLSQASSAYNTQPNDLLLTILSLAYSKVFSKNRFSVHIEGHGRQVLEEEMDIGRTVGWFTLAYPIILESDVANIGRTIWWTKEMFRKVPNHGIGYGILQYIGDSVLKKDLCEDVLFNYMGSLQESRSSEDIFGINMEMPQGAQSHLSNVFGPPLALNGAVENGCLRISIDYNKDIHSQDSIKWFVEEFEKQAHLVTEHCMNAVPSITPSDLGELEWEYGELESVMQHFAKEDITLDRIFPLTSMQQGMLYHRISAPESSAYHIQSVYKVENRLLHKQVLDAIEATACKHPMLHASIIYKDVSIPRQAILSGRLVEVSETELQNSGQEDIMQKINSLCKADLSRGFDLQDDSLIRIQIIQSAKCSYLLFSIHHIIIDGWSVPIYMNEFLRNLSIICDGHSLKEVLPEAYTFENAVREIAAKDSSSGLQYWRELLADYETPTEIPISPSLKGEIRESTLLNINRTVNKELTEKLVLLSRKHDVTINTLLEAAWGIILQRYSNSSDVVFGKVVSGRNLDTTNVENMVGLFINTIPVRVKSRTNETLPNLLLSIQQQAVTSSQHDYIALNEIQKQSVLGSDLIKSLFIFENYYVQTATKADNVQLTQIYNREETNYNFSLTITLKEELDICIKANSALYSENILNHIYSNLVSLLSSAVDDSEGKICNLSVLSDEEMHKVINEFNNTDTDYPSEKTVVEIFEEQVTKTPNNIAVVFNDVRWSYSELNNKANVLAHRLRAMCNIKPNDYVVIITERKAEMTASIFGILKSGAAYVPITPDYPDNRIEYILSDCRPKAIICGSAEIQARISSILTQLGDNSLPSIYLENISEVEAFSSPQSENPILVNTPDDTVYVLYTSGTTGQPKGVLNKHRGLVNRLFWMNGEFPLGENGAILQKTTFTFDVSVWELTGWSFIGAKVVLLKNGEEKEPQKICDTIYKEKISVVHFVPSVFNILKEYLEINLEEINKLSSLNYFFVGGESLQINTAREFMDMAVRAGLKMKLANLYGPTEASIDITSFECSKENLQHLTTIPIGRPIWNTQIYILNDNRLCGVNMPGELCVAGDNIAKGYLNKLELSAERFIPNPYGEGLLYKTGDLAKWREDGVIEFLGRIDHQVKIRGFRIELGEIENCLLKIEEIKSVAVITKKDAYGENYLCAYYTATKTFDKEQLVHQLSKTLPEYMIPTVFMQLDKLPLTFNHKLDRRALPEPILETGAKYIEPENNFERLVVNAFSEVLKIDSVGVDDSFYNLGGDSIKAIKLSTKLPGIPVAEIMHRQSPRKIAALCPLLGNGHKQRFVKAGKGTVSSHPAIFFLPPVAGMSVAFMKLIDTLGYDGEVYIMDDPKFELLHISDMTLDYTLERYVEEIAHKFRNGDFLIGYSHGGKLVPLLYSLLRKKSLNPGKVVAIDTIPLSNFAGVSEIETTSEILKNFSTNFCLTNALSSEELKPFETEDDMIAQLSLLLSESYANNESSIYLTNSIRLKFNVFKANYLQEEINGIDETIENFSLILSADNIHHVGEITKRWTSYIMKDRINVYTINASHDELVNEYCGELAKVLNTIISKDYE